MENAKVAETQSKKKRRHFGPLRLCVFAFSKSFRTLGSGFAGLEVGGEAA
jgi:hypothetical protein